MARAARMARARRSHHGAAVRLSAAVAHRVRWRSPASTPCLRCPPRASTAHCPLPSSSPRIVIERADLGFFSLLFFFFFSLFFLSFSRPRQLRGRRHAPRVPDAAHQAGGDGDFSARARRALAARAFLPLVRRRAASGRARDGRAAAGARGAATAGDALGAGGADAERGRAETGSLSSLTLCLSPETAREARAADGDSAAVRDTFSLSLSCSRLIFALVSLSHPFSP